MKRGGDDTIVFFGTSGLGVFRGSISCTEIKMNRNFNRFTDFKSLEPKVPTFCFVTGCVSARRDRRYQNFSRPTAQSTILR
jgi:hypothetical protein